jgi:hypothetical protein
METLAVSPMGKSAFSSGRFTRKNTFLRCKLLVLWLAHGSITYSLQFTCTTAHKQSCVMFRTQKKYFLSTFLILQTHAWNSVRLCNVHVSVYLSLEQINCSVSCSRHKKEVATLHLFLMCYKRKLKD